MKDSRLLPANPPTISPPIRPFRKCNPMKTTSYLLALVAILAATLAAAAPVKSPAERRAALLKCSAQGAAAIPTLSAALQDENLVVRRTAVRLLVDLGAPARAALIPALDNDDVLVRRSALATLCDPPTAENLPHLAKAMKDADPLVRLTAVNLLVNLKPRTQEINTILEGARQDGSQQVRDVASQAVWPFFRENISLRDRKDWDHEITVVQTIPLPTEGWRLQTDPKQTGHLQKWFDPSFNDSAWKPIKIAATWEDQIGPYDGVAWYRGTFDLPAKPQQLGTEIVFGAVDEIAWVWLNGQYIGQHDLGTEGWNIPFALDITKELKWGEKNQITIRVQDSAFAGGIWKPVTIQVLQ